MSALPAIPDHVLLRPIGRGAYGEVWLARNVMGTFRAVKVISRNQFESERPYEREFAGIRRYEPVSRSSGGLVHVLQVGRNDAEGYFYYVMELADDAAQRGPSSGASTDNGDTSSLAQPDSYVPRTLRSDLKRLGRLRTEDCLRLALDVTSGLAQLHRAGLVHRDVKPCNIIYVNGRAKLADIGLITAEGESRTFVGTEGYIPPEGPGSPAADLYALGIVLYQASTGLPPERFPDIPPDWLANPDGDAAFEFHEIVLKACEGQRARRYQNIEQLQADLALLQSGQSVRHVRALQRRYARLRLAGMAGTALLLCAVGAALLAHYRASVAALSRAKEVALREQVQGALTRTEAAEREARQQLYTALLEQARATVRSRELGQRVRALDAIRRAAAISNTAELRGAVLSATALPDLRLKRELPKPPGTTLLNLDPSFERMALARGVGPVEILSVENGQRLALLPPASTNLATFLATWSADGRYLAVKRDRTHDGQIADVEVWEISGRRRVLLLQNVTFGAIAFHPKLPVLMSAQPGGVLAVWDLENGNELKRFTLDLLPLSLRYSPDGERFAVAHAPAHDRFAVSVHLASNGVRLVSQDYPDLVAELAWHPSGHWLATADHTGAVRLLDSETGETRLVGRHNAEAAFVAFSPDGAYLLSGGWERELICWNVETMQTTFTLALNSFRAQFKADGSACAIITDNAVQLYAFEHPSGRREFAEDLGSRVNNAVFSADGHWVAASGGERLAVWDLAHAGPGALVTNGADTRLYFSSQGELFGSRDDHCFRWHLKESSAKDIPPRVECVRLGAAEEIASLCLVSNQLIFTGPQGTCVSAPEPPAQAEQRWVETVRGIGGASPDARWLGIYQPYSSRLYVYQLPGLETVATLTNRANISGFDFSPSGEELAVGSFQGVELWNTATWTRTRVLTNSLNLLYTPDGRSCWVTRDFRRAELCDARSLEVLLPLPPGMHPLAVSPDGRYLAASTEGRRLQLWDITQITATLKELGLEW